MLFPSQNFLLYKSIFLIEIAQLSHFWQIIEQNFGIWISGALRPLFTELSTAGLTYELCNLFDDWFELISPACGLHSLWVSPGVKNLVNKGLSLVKCLLKIILKKLCDNTSFWNKYNKIRNTFFCVIRFIKYRDMCSSKITNC